MLAYARSAYGGAREEFSMPPTPTPSTPTVLSWTPVPLSSTGTITPNAGGTRGRYVIDGNVIYAWFRVQVTSVAGPTGTLRITGLPVGTGIPSTGVDQAFAAAGSQFAAGAGTGLQGLIFVNENPAVLRVYSMAAGSQVLLAPFVQANTLIYGSAVWTIQA